MHELLVISVMLTLTKNEFTNTPFKNWCNCTIVYGATTSQKLYVTNLHETITRKLGYKPMITSVRQQNKKVV